MTGPATPLPPAPPCLVALDAPRAPTPSWTHPFAGLRRVLFPELPRGGTTILPRSRVVAYYGAPQAEALGALGVGPLPAAVRRLEAQARAYARRRRPVQPALELIADLAKPIPWSTGLYVQRQADATVCRYLAAARAARALLILDLQPGHADFVSELRHFLPYLREPDVSLALDPEWSVPPGTVPGQVIGHTDAAVVARVAEELSRLVRENRLPDKLLVVHEFTPTMIRGTTPLRRLPGVELTLNVDGVGLPPDKLLAYRTLAAPRQPWFHGFKLFYEEDRVLMTPREVLALRPQPDVVIYE